jgi:hypothetical protein
MQELFGDIDEEWQMDKSQFSSNDLAKIKLILKKLD